MNKTLCCLSLLALSGLPLSSHCQEHQHPRFIEVTGNAEIHAEVDQVTWTISIRGEGESLAEASQALEEHEDRLKQSTAQAGFPENTLRLSNIRSGKDYEHGPQGRTFLGYYAQRSIQVRLDELEKRQALEAILLADDSIEIHHIQTKSSKHESLREEVLKAAVAAARTKAEKLAAEAGVTLGKINYLKEGTSPLASPVTSNRVMLAPADAGGVESFDQVGYNATVVVSYGIAEAP